MNDRLQNRHDKFFKVYFGRREVALDLVAHYLPVDVIDWFDFDTFKLRNNSFIDQDLAKYFSDLLYTIQLRGGQTAYIYLLFDHKSYIDQWVSWQFFGYLKEIWGTSLADQEAIRKKQPRNAKNPLYLAPILPLIVYHDPQQWTVSTEFIGLFNDLPEPLRPYLPNFRYWLWDLSDCPPEQITGNILFRVATLLLKYIHDDEKFQENLPDILNLLRDLADKPTVLGHLRIILTYLYGYHPKNRYRPLEISTSKMQTEHKQKRLCPSNKQWLNFVNN